MKTYIRRQQHKNFEHQDIKEKEHKVRKPFSKVYRKHYELISKFNVGLKMLLREGLSERAFYGELVYKLKKLIGRNDFSFQFRKIIICDKCI